MKRQRGVAAVTALLIVAVAASTATYMLAQQSALLNQAALVANRAQADQYARAGLDWVRGVLAQDAKSGGVDSLREAWAQPIAALPVERAIVSGHIEDEQGKFNLNNLVRGNTKSEPDIAACRRLFEGLAIPPELADAVVDWIDFNDDLSGPGGAENAYYLSLARPYRTANRPMVQVEELHRVRGFTPAHVAKLRPFVTALEPGPDGMSKLNVNTARAEVLAAVMPQVPADDIAAIVAARGAKPFSSTADVSQRVKSVPASALPANLDVKSQRFLARIQVVQDDAQLATEALLERGQDGVTVAWKRPLY